MSHAVSYAGVARSSGWIDFELYQGAVIFVPVKVNGHPATALLNLGAPSKIDKTFAASIGARPQAAPVRVQIGAMTLAEVDAPSDALADNFAGHAYDFFLGEDVFDQAAVDIDFANHRLAFRDPRSVTKPSGAVTVPLVKVGTGRSVPVAIDGLPAGLFHLEFGNDSPLMVTRPYAETKKLFAGRKVSQRYTGPSKEPEGMATLSHITFAGADFRQVPTTIVPDSLFDDDWFDAQHLSGVVGMPLLSRYRLIIDTAHDRLYATPGPKTANQSFERERLGMSTAHGKVVFIAPGGPAQAAGFKLGEEVAIFNGKPPTAVNLADYAAMHYGPAGASVTFTMVGGEQRRVILADYY